MKIFIIVEFIMKCLGHNTAVCFIYVCVNIIKACV